MRTIKVGNKVYTLHGEPETELEKKLYAENESLRYELNEMHVRYKALVRVSRAAREDMMEERRALRERFNLISTFGA